VRFQREQEEDPENKNHSPPLREEPSLKQREI